VIAALLVAGAVFLLWPTRLTVRRPRRRSRPRLSIQDPRRVLAGSVVLVVALALLLGGPVAAVVGGVYALLGARALRRRAAGRRAAAQRVTALDDLAALAADLRAGLVTTAPGNGSSRVKAVWRLAERTGAPAADLVERLEADARAGDRAAASAAAQAAGAQATALLLAGLPIGGIGLGVAIGADPVHVLLHTRIGAACAIAAVLLQAAGLRWAERLAR
jgi:tight adherence protein B